MSSTPRKKIAGGAAFNFPGSRGTWVSESPRELRAVYADGSLNMFLYLEEDGGQPDLGLLRQAEQLWEGLRREDPRDAQARGYLVVIRRRLAQLLAARGENEESSRWRSQSLTTARGERGLFYEIALEYARMLGPIDRLPSKLDAYRRGVLRQAIVDDTIDMLREAVADGFKDAARLRGEAAFAPLRSDANFQAIVSGLELPTNVFAPP